MKLSVTLMLLAVGSQTANAFTVAPHQRAGVVSSTQHFMFGGAGAGTPAEDDAEGEEQMKQAAAAMGMSVAEYKLAMQARTKLQDAMDSRIVTGGKSDTVLVERDVNNPPKKFDITITEAGKALGREAVSKALVDALQTCSDAAKKGRQEAQQEMLKFVQNQSPK
mmetsp:Transcript_17138/g.27794  ORF Transcript_17138/g.27794 Transcript_17138/m.27794 type:complete len:165 (+) Transcript_17138:121-615(+)